MVLGGVDGVGWGRWCWVGYISVECLVMEGVLVSLVPIVGSQSVDHLNVLVLYYDSCCGLPGDTGSFFLSYSHEKFLLRKMTNS